MIGAFDGRAQQGGCWKVKNANDESMEEASNLGESRGVLLRIRPIGRGDHGSIDLARPVG